MLKIKKEYFNKEELKKYGFILSPITEKHYTYKEPKVYMTINEYGDVRIIGHTYKEQDLIYDLITAGIIEKVPYERRKKKSADQQKIETAIENIEQELKENKIDNINGYAKATLIDLLRILKGGE